MKPVMINDLEPQTIAEIFRLLPATDCAKIATCQKLWRSIAADDSLWQVWAKEDFLLEQATAPTGHLQDTWRYKTYAKRAIRAWRTIEDWTKVQHPDLYLSLGAPATETELDEAEHLLEIKLPDSLRVIYRLHDGQELSCDERFPSLTPDDSMFYGLLGGYSFYDHVVCTRLLPIEHAARSTIDLRKRHSQKIDYGDGVLLTGSIMTRKEFMLMDDGSQLRVSSCDRDRTWDAAPPGGNDALLRWLEAFADSLKNQLGCCHLHQSTFSFGICLYPTHQPWQKTAVTKGVRVQAAAIFIPELSKQRAPHDIHEVYFFSYKSSRLLSTLTFWRQLDSKPLHDNEPCKAEAPNSKWLAGCGCSVEFSLLPVAEQLASWPDDAGPFRPITSVQLQTRHWIIRDYTGEVAQDIRGDGVVGRHPILLPGEGPSVYQSCTHQPHPRGSMEGFFEFVEGTISQPTGPAFDVECPQFMLEVPQYVL